MVITSLGRAVAEQGLAVVAAEQEGEPVQVLAQLADVVGGVADELPQGGAEAPRSRASHRLRNCSSSASSAASTASSLTSGMAIHRLPGRGCAA